MYASERVSEYITDIVNRRQGVCQSASERVNVRMDGRVYEWSKVSESES